MWRAYLADHFQRTSGWFGAIIVFPSIWYISIYSTQPNVSHAMVSRRSWCSSSYLTSIFVVLIVGLGMTPQATAQIQEMTVTPVEAERIVSRDASVAHLVIDSAIPGLTIRSNIGEVAQEQQGSRTVISLGTGRQRITFSAPSYQNASILIDVKAREQYAYEVVGAASERIMELRADFEILPRVAQLTVNGERVGSSRSLVLPLGPNRVQIEADGYESIDTEIIVSPQERNVYRFELDLIALYALIIETTPPGAVLQLDGVTLETVSPYTGFFPAGTYEFWLPSLVTRHAHRR